MITYLLNDNPKVIMDLEDVIDYLQVNFHFTLDKVQKVEDTEKQSGMLEVLIDSFFTVIDEDEEDEEDYWENDIKEREREYRKMQGF